MNTLGIDPSTVATGWALLDQAGGLLASGTLKPTGDVESRINQVAWDCGRIYSNHRPESVYCEEQILSRIPRKARKNVGALVGMAKVKALLHKDEEDVSNVATALALRGLSRAIGFSIHACSSRQLQAVFLRPATWRAAFNCPPRAGKAVALAQVKLLLRSRGIPFADFSPDEVEAYGIAEAGRLLELRSRLCGRSA